MSPDFAPDHDTPTLFAHVAWPAVLTILGVAGLVLVPLLGALLLAV